MKRNSKVLIPKLGFRGKPLLSIILISLLYFVAVLHGVEATAASYSFDADSLPKSYDYLLFPDTVPSIDCVLSEIQDRYNNNEKDSFRIILANGIYSESIKRDFVVDTSLYSDLYIEVWGLGITTQILGNNSISTNSGNLHFTLRNISISGGERGIKALTDLSANAITFLEMYNCKIYNNIGTSYGTDVCMDGAGIYANGPTIINECEIYDNIGLNWIDVEHNNFSRGGGIAVVNNTSYNTEISECHIYGNEANAGGGIYVSGSAPVFIQRNKIYSNTRKYYVQGSTTYEEGFGEGVYAYQCNNLVFTDNVVYEQIAGSAGYRDIIPVSTAVVIESCGSSEPHYTVSIVNNSFMDNDECHGLWVLMPTGKTLIRNNLACGNMFGINLSDCEDNYITMDYNNSYDNGILNNEVINYFISTPNWIVQSNNGEFDPKVSPEYYPIWDASVISPLIDAGYPHYFDPDGTVSDIGAYRTCQHDYWGYVFDNEHDTERWHWVSYPILNTITDDALLAREFFKELLSVHQTTTGGYLHDIPTYLEEIMWYEEGAPQQITWDDSIAQWNYYDSIHYVSSPQGYKIRLQARAHPDFPYPVVLKESGYQTSVNTQFPIYGGVENWLGYFREDARMPQDAFADIWDDITMIKAKDWSLIRMPGTGNIWGMHGRVMPLQNGDMVIVRTNQDHSFRWGVSHPVPPRSKSAPKEFVFDEKADYIPIYINIADEIKLGLKEIGLMVNGVCKGAVVVEDNLEQISAYVASASELSEGNVELVFYYGDSKSAGAQLKNLKLAAGSFAAKYGVAGSTYPYFEIDLDDKALENVVPLEFTLKPNYPNPFNPRTTIQYSLPEAAKMRLEIYNIKGQLVKTLVNGEMPAGMHNVVWDGRDSKDRAVASGVYFYRISSPQNTQTKRMLLMK